MRVYRLICLLCVLPFLAEAEPNADVNWQTKPSAAELNRPELTFDVRLIGAPLGTFLDEPSEANKLKTLPNGRQARIPYPGFGGLGYSLGLTLGLTYNGFLGFETGVISREESATGTYNIGAGSYDLDVSQTTLTVPLLLRLTLPTSSVQPSLLFGLGLHFPSDTKLESVGVGGVSAEADNFNTLNFGFELEFKLPVANYDIRIPLSMRGYHNQGLGASAAERMEFRGCNATGLVCNETVFITEWQWAAEVFLGLSMHTQLLE